MNRLRAALAVELRAAADAVLALDTGQRLPLGIEAAARRWRLEGASRAALHDIAAGTVRRLACCRAVAAQLNRKPPAPAVAALQCVAIAQLMPAATLAADADVAQDGAETPHRHAAVTVDQAVDAARLDPATAAAAPFLNATLRRFVRERDALLATAERDPVARWNYPAWWIEQVRTDHPTHWRDVLAAGNTPGALTLRVDTSRVGVADYVARLAAAGMLAERIGPRAVRVARAGAVQALPGWDDGWVSVQDAGAQLAAPLLDVRDGQRVLDACAAPGGKTGHLLELADVRVLALDADAARLARVRENLQRLRRDAELRAGDAREPASWWDGEPFDRILLDAPCSASGIVRRHPDVRWLRRRRDLATLCATQSALLEALWPLLAPGGKLLYATCSVFRDEGEGRIERFLSARPDATRLALRWRWRDDAPEAPIGQLLPRSAPPIGAAATAGTATAAGAAGAAADAGGPDHDGFFYALIQKAP